MSTHELNLDVIHGVDKKKILQRFMQNCFMHFGNDSILTKCKIRKAQTLSRRYEGCYLDYGVPQTVLLMTDSL